MLHIHRGRAVQIVAAVLLVLGASARAAAPIDVPTADNVDERLFLIRNLEVMYSSWPTNVNDPAAYAKASVGLRVRAVQLQQHIKTSGLGDELADRYGDLLKLLDLQSDFLFNIGKIEAAAGQRATSERVASGSDAAGTAASTYGMASQTDMSGGQAAGVALVAGLIQYCVDDYQKQQVRDQAKKDAVAAEAQRITNEAIAAYARAQATAAKLTEQHRWSRGEVGFENLGSEISLIQKWTAANDMTSLYQYAVQRLQLRPRDPFLRRARNVYACTNTLTTADVVRSYAEDTVQTMALIPRGAIYDEYREDLLTQAALMATEARNREVAAGIEPLGSTAYSRYAVDLWENVSRFDPQDATGDVRGRQMYAYLANNQPRDALRVANEIVTLRQNDLYYAYYYACINARLGSFDLTLQWLKHSMALGNCAIPFMKKDPSLASLREQKAEAYKALTKVNFVWNYHPGVLNDDITVTNNSPFAITNFVFNVHLEAYGKSYDPSLKADIIQPGQTFRWSNCVSIPGSKPVNMRTTFSCDQNQ